MDNDKQYRRTLNICLSLPESSEDDFRRLIEPTDGAWECDISAKIQRILDSIATPEMDKCIELLFFFTSGMSERGYKSVCKLELILSKEAEYNPEMSYTTCPSCHGEGILHADGYPSIGCSRCNGEGEVFE